VLLALHLGRLQGQQGPAARSRSRVGKYNNITKAIEICRVGPHDPRRQRGLGEYPVIRHANNLESVLTYEGTVEMHTLVIGQALTGESAFR
jgi:glutaryl-CoA dehydrogenase